MNSFLSGFTLGFVLAAPIGPMAMLCIQHTMRSGWKAGMRVGLGIATGDALYAALAAFGVTPIISLLLAYHGVIQLVGGVLLAWIGLQIVHSAFRKKQAQPEAKVNSTRLYLSSVFLTLTNPMTVAVYSAAFSTVAFHTQSLAASFQLVTGVFSGSFGWWVILSLLANFFRGKQLVMKGINFLSGLAVLVFGFWQLVDSLSLYG